MENQNPNPNPNQTQNENEKDHDCIFSPFKELISNWHLENDEILKKDPEAIVKNNIIVFGSEATAQGEGYESHNCLMTAGSLRIVKDCIVDYALEDDAIAALIIEAGKEIMFKKMFAG